MQAIEGLTTGCVYCLQVDWSANHYQCFDRLNCLCLQMKKSFSCHIRQVTTAVHLRLTGNSE